MKGILVKGQNIFGVFDKFAVVMAETCIDDPISKGWDLCAIDDSISSRVYKLANFSTESRAKIELDMIFSAMISGLDSYTINLEDNTILEECFYDVLDGLSVRTINCVRRMGIRTIAELLEMKQIDFFKTRNLGRKSFKELMIAIKKNGFILQKHLSDIWNFDTDNWVKGSGY